MLMRPPTILLEVRCSRHVPAMEEFGPSTNIGFLSGRSLAQQSSKALVTQAPECPSGPQALSLRQPDLRHRPRPAASVAYTVPLSAGTPATFSGSHELRMCLETVNPTRPSSVVTPPYLRQLPSKGTPPSRPRTRTRTWRVPTLPGRSAPARLCCNLSFLSLIERWPGPAREHGTRPHGVRRCS